MKNLVELFEKYGINLSEKQENQFDIFFNFLISENEKYNLTAITEENEVLVKHFLDSVLPYKEIPQNAKVIDIGTGAGFPGVPLKILRPDIKLTLVDSLQKRVNFLQSLLSMLEINDVKTVHSRAEDYVKTNRETFDIALSRAVAQIPTLSEYLLPYVKVGGKVLMYKGSNFEDEINQGKRAISTLGGKLDRVLQFKIEEIDIFRAIVIIKKQNSTNPLYPRGKNLPKTKPIL